MMPCTAWPASCRWAGGLTGALDTPGLRVPVTWKNSPTLPAGNGPVRLRVAFAGVRPEDIGLYAMYVTSAGQ